MKQYLRRETAALAITLAALALPLAGVTVYVYQKHQWAQNRLSELEPRYARLLGMEAGSERLAQARERAQAQLAQYIYPQDQDANQTGNDVQQRVRSILTSAGLSIASSQVLPTKKEKNKKHIPLSVRAKGEMLALQTALAGLAEQKPAILIDTMVVQGYGAPVKGVQTLAVQFGFSVLRVQP